MIPTGNTGNTFNLDEAGDINMLEFCPIVLKLRIYRIWGVSS